MTAAHSPGPGDQHGDKVVGWSVVLPAGWWHVKIDQRRHRSVQALLDRLLASLPRDRVFQLRRDLTAQFEDFLDRAEAEGSTDAYLLADLRYGLPLAASCLATITPYQLPDDVPAEALALTLAQHGDRTGSVVVEGRACATLVRRTPARLTPEQASGLQDAGEVFTTTRMDAYLPFPDGGRMLLLSYSTPVEPVAEQLVLLFEAMTGSLRWRWE